MKLDIFLWLFWVLNAFMAPSIMKANQWLMSFITQGFSSTIIHEENSQNIMVVTMLRY